MSKSSIPLLKQLNNYGKNGTKLGISGDEIGKLLEYSSLLDLLPGTNGIAVQEPSGDRVALKHSELSSFVEKEFDLQQFGLPPLSRVAILLPNGPELAVCMISLISRWCAVPINPQSTSSEIELEMAGTQAQAIIVLSGEGGAFGAAALQAADKLGVGVIMLEPSAMTCGLFSLSLLRPVRLSPVRLPPPSPLHQHLMQASDYGHSQTVLILHTSGTSGNKKRVPYSLDALIIGVACIVSSWNLSPSDVNLNMMPLFHIGGIVRNVFSPILSGGSVIACSGFDAVLFWEVLRSTSIDFRVSWYYAAPTMHHAILQQADFIAGEDGDETIAKAVKPVRMIANAAGALLPALAASLSNTFGATILTGYGMTECMPISSPPQSYRLDPVGTSGIPCGPSVIIVDADHKDLLPSNTTGYESTEDNSINEEAFFTIQGEPGWFDTGDLGYLDENSYLFISGRSKEIINRGGETISPFEIEEALVQHPDIREACAFSAPHDHFQETVGAVVVTEKNRPRIDLPTLHKYLGDRLHRSKWPQVIVFMNGLPKNNTNKVLRIRLAQRFSLKAVNEDTAPITRLFEAECPPVGALLTTPIPVSSVTVNVEGLGQFVKKINGITSCVCLHVDLSGRMDSIVLFISPKSTELEEKAFMICHQSLDAYVRPYLVISMEESSLQEKSAASLTIAAIERYNRKALVLPRNPIEVQVELVWRTLLASSSTLSVTSSFFDLGGDSLQAGQLVNAIRKKLHVPISVADLFLAPTIEKLSHKISTLKTLGSPSVPSAVGESSQKKNGAADEENGNGVGGDNFRSWEYSNQNYSNTSWGVLLIQALPMLLLYPIRRITIWFTIAIPWVYLMENGMGRFNALVLAIIFSRCFGGVVNPLIGVLAKWIIIGRYKPGKYPLWSADYLRWWLVEQVILVFGKGFVGYDIPIIGHHIVKFYHVLMGAKIGKNVRIHKDAKLGQSDLLTIGDDVVIDVATMRCFGLEEGHMVLLPIVIGNNCSVGLKSSVAPGSTVPSGTHIGPQSSSHETDWTDPENAKYCRPAFQGPPLWLMLFVGIPILILVMVFSMIPWFIGLKFMVASAKSDGWYSADIHSVYHAFLWWITPQRLKFYFLIRIVKRCVVPFFRLFFVILIKKTFIGKFTPMSLEDKQSNWNRFRYWLMSKLLSGGHLGGVAKLVGTHYEIISIIFRALGAKVGERVYWPGSGLEIVEYDLLDVGNDVVFGSRSVVLTSSSEKSDYVTFQDGCMIADRCVILPGVTLKKGSVLGSGSLAPEGHQCPTGSIWVGSQDGKCINVSPEDPTYDRKDTNSPFGKAFYGKLAPYFVIPLWGVVAINFSVQAVCTCYHNAPTVLALMTICFVNKFEHEDIRHPVDLFRLLLIAYIPLFLAMSVTALLLDIAAKWVLLGRRKQGAYPWDKSSYCQRWQLYLTLEEIRRGESGKVGILDLIRGSQYLVWYFRAHGSRIGDNVCLYPNGGDPMMTEPDLVTIHDGAGVDDASLIAHINTRGVFRLNPLSVGRNCVLKSHTRLLSGAQMSDYSMMLEHTLVLAGDIVDSGAVWQGWPSNTHISLEMHRKKLSMSIDRSVFRTSASEAIASRVRSRREEDAIISHHARSMSISGGGEKNGRHVSFQNDPYEDSVDSSSAHKVRQTLTRSVDDSEPLSERTPLLESKSKKGVGTYSSQSQRK